MVQLILTTPLHDKQIVFEAKDCLICEHCAEVRDARVSDKFRVVAYKIYCNAKEAWIEHIGLLENWCEEYEEYLTKLDDFWEWLSFKLGED